MTPSIHPLAELIPEMDAEQFAELREDIRRRGLDQPIILHDGLVLDGRHRLRACEDVGVEPRFETFDGTSPVEFVLSVNVKRRHLTPSQRAAVAVEFLPALEEEARRRQGTRTDLSTTSGSRDPEVVSTHRAREDAGALVGVSGATVDRARRVKDEDPEAFERVKAGEMAVRTADNELRKKRPPRQPAPPKPPLDLSSAHNLAIANKAKARLWNVISGLSGYQSGLEDFRLDRALAVATRDEIEDWISILQSASKSFNKFARDLRNLSSTIEGDERLAA